MLLLIFPLNLLCLFTARLIMNRSYDSLEHSILLALNSQMSLLDHRITTANTILYTFPASDQHCMKLLKQEEDWHYALHRQQVVKTLQEDMVLSNTADDFFFYMKEKEDFLAIHIPGSEPIDSDKLRAYLQDAESMRTKWYLITLDNQPYLICYYNWENYGYGALLRLSPILSELKSIVAYDSLQTSFSDSACPGQKNTLAYSASSSKAAFYLNLQIDEKEVFRNISFGQKLLFYILILYVFSLPLLYILFRRHVTVPLNILNHAHGELMQGNENYRIETLPASKDFEDAYHSFNTMAGTLQFLRLENINKELAAKQLQLTNLQLQIRPHFLLNTLNLLYALVQSHKEAPAQDMILYLSNYFRYMFRSGNNLSMFDHEMELIEEYLHVSSFKYPDAFDISYQINPCVSMVRVPALLLHNFMENIISHSLMPGKVIHIVFYAEYDEQAVTIQISDDGRGMTPENVEMINHADFDHIPSGQHVGIQNSIKRLKYHYGEEASLTVESTLNMGSTFTICFPYDLEENIQ